MRKRFFKLVRLVLLAVCAMWNVFAQAAQYPDRPIMFVLGVAAGGAGDVVSRLISKQLTDQLGQRIIVENKPGAGAVAAAKYVINSKPDGYTIFLSGNGLAISQALYKRPPFNLLTQLTPISNIVKTDVVIYVGKGSRFKTIKQLAQEAKEHPGRVTIGVGLVGTSQDIVAELFKAQSGLDLSIVPFRSTGNLYTALFNGEIDAAVDLAPVIIGQVRNGDLVPLAIASASRSPILPDVPTLMEAGLGTNDTSTWMQIAAPAGTPPAVLDRLNKAIRLALSQPALRKQFSDLGFTPTGCSVSEAGAFTAGEVSKWKTLVRATGIPQQ